MMIVVDSSGSMTGDKQRATDRAVSQFLAIAPANAPIGVVSFSRTARLLTAPTADRAAVLNAVSRLKSFGMLPHFRCGHTSLPCARRFQALPAALVLTDGQDTTSKASLADTEQVLSSGVCAASFVRLQTDKPHVHMLNCWQWQGTARAFSLQPDADGIAGVFVQSLTTTNPPDRDSRRLPSRVPQCADQAISAIDLSISRIHVGLLASGAVGPPAPPVASTVLFSLAATVFAVLFHCRLLTEGTDRARRRRVDALVTEYAMRRVEAGRLAPRHRGRDTRGSDSAVLVRAARRALALRLRALASTCRQRLDPHPLGLSLVFAIIAGVASGTAVTALAVGVPAGFIA